MTIMRQSSLMILCLLASASAAQAAQDEDSNAKSRAAVAVLSELSRRSALPEDELSRLLADCDANQQAMYFCAWRDQVAKERKFNRALEEKKYALVACKAELEARATSWKKSRDRSCAQSAKNEFDGGSMNPTAQAICMAAETARMTHRLERISACKRGRR